MRSMKEISKSRLSFRAQCKRVRAVKLKRKEERATRARRRAGEERRGGIYTPQWTAVGHLRLFRRKDKRGKWMMDAIRTRQDDVDAYMVEA